MKIKGYSLSHVIIIIIITSVISALTTGLIFVKNLNNEINYMSLAEDEDVQNFLSAYSSVVDNYYEDVDKKGAIESAINGMMDYLHDSYTTYLPEKEADNLLSQLNATYTGIGITIKENIVQSIIFDSPAEKVGIAIGDEIISINGISTDNMQSEQIAASIKNHGKDEIVLVVNRNGEEYTFVTKAETLNTPSVSYYMLTDNIGYMQISIFGRNLSKEVKKTLEVLTGLGMQKLVIDVRNNSGGYLEQAYKTSSLFLNEGKLIYSLEVKNKIESYEDNDDNSTDFPIVILTNSSTASAAEILTAALKDSYDNAIIVGTVTFGKGKVQQTYNLDSGGLIKYTSSKWLRPNGECIDEIGIVPDYQIENEIIYDQNENGHTIIKEYIDNQLDKAIELLNY